MYLVVSVEGGTRHEAGDIVAINVELYSVDVMISQELLDALMQCCEKNTIKRGGKKRKPSIIRGRSMKSRSRHGSNLKCL